MVDDAEPRTRSFHRRRHFALPGVVRAPGRPEIIEALAALWRVADGCTRVLHDRCSADGAETVPVPRGLASLLHFFRAGSNVLVVAFPAPRVSGSPPALWAVFVLRGCDDELLAAVFAAAFRLADDAGRPVLHAFDRFPHGLLPAQLRAIRAIFRLVAAEKPLPAGNADPFAPSSRP